MTTTTTNVWIAAGTDTDGQRVVVHGITEQDAREAMIDFYETATIDTVTEIATADGIGYEEGSTVYWYDPANPLRRVERTF